MFQFSKFLAVVLFVGFLLTDVGSAQVVQYGTSYSVPTYSTPTDAVPTQTYYSPPVWTNYSGPTAIPAYANTRGVRFRNPYSEYSPWYNTTQPTYGDYTYNQRFDGPNEAYAKTYNSVNGLSYRNGLRAGLSRASVSGARERDDILRARAFTESRGLTFQNGPIRGALGVVIRSAASD